MADWENATWATVYPNGPHGGAESGQIVSADEDDVTVLSDGTGEKATGPTNTAHFES